MPKNFLKNTEFHTFAAVLCFGAAASLCALAFSPGREDVGKDVNDYFRQTTAPIASTTLAPKSPNTNAGLDFGFAAKTP